MEKLATLAECQPNTNAFIINELYGRMPEETPAGERVVALVQVVH